MRPHSINYFFGLFLTLRSSFDLFCSGPKIAYLFPVPPPFDFLLEKQHSIVWVNLRASGLSLLGILDLCEAQPG